MGIKNLTEWTLVLTFSVAVGGAQVSTPISSRISSSQAAQVDSKYGRLPLMFEANQGNTNSQVKFLSHGKGYSIFLTSGGMVLALRPSQATSSATAPEPLLSKGRQTFSPVRELEAAAHRQDARAASVIINLVGASPSPEIVGEETLPTKVNYFIGRDPKNWRTKIPTYARIRYRNVYPGIDLVYYGHNGRVEYDFDLAPGADPTKIQFSIQGADALHIDDAGNLALTGGAGELQFQTPQLYQEIDGVRARVSGAFVLRDATHVGFSVGNYDNAKPLVIDPVLVYSTFLGGSSNDFSNGIAVDSSGDAYVIGLTDSPDFPLATLGSYGSTQFRMFLTEFDPTGGTLLFADYFGGTSGDDEASAVALDSSGNPYVTGCAMSSDFPVANAYQSTLAGSQDAFLVKFSSDGSSILYSTYLGGANLTSIGGSTEQFGASISVDPAGEAIVGGVTMATDFPLTNAYQSSVSPDQFGDWGIYGFLTKFTARGTSLVYSTYVAGNTLNTSSCSGCFPDSEISGVAADALGNAYITGFTTTTDFPTTSGAYDTASPGYYLSDVGFVSKFSNSGAIAYSTYLAGQTSSFLTAIAVDSTGSAYVTGYDIANDNFPIVTTSICDPSSAACNGTVIAKLDPTGAYLVYSTFLGTSNNMVPGAIQVDSSGDAFIVGTDVAFDLANPIEQYQGGNDGDIVVAEISPSATTLLMATFLGGVDWESVSGLALDSSGNAYLTGSTMSTDFPVTESGFQTTEAGASDVFITEINPNSSEPAVAMVPYALQFGSQGILTTSAAQTVLLRNLGSAALAITRTTISPNFAETDDCGTSVPAASSCTFSITFTPIVVGNLAGTLAITDDAHGSPQTVALSGTGTLGLETMGVSPSNLNFSATPVGYAAALQTVTVTNGGSSTMSLSNVLVSRDFSVRKNNCGSIAANGICTLQISYSPAAAGTIRGTLRLTPTGGNPQTVELAGSGIDFVTSAVNNKASVTSGGTATYQLNVGSSGGSFSNPVAFSCTGAPAYSTCAANPSSIVPGNNSTVIVTVKTAAALASVMNAPSRTEGRFPAFWLAGPFGIFGILAMDGQKRRKKRSHYSRVATAIVALLVLAGCGSGSGNAASPANLASGATPAGTYALTIAATSGTAHHSTLLTLTVR